jgi:hypothetical protein
MQKRQDIELLRVISVFAIVWYHSGANGHEISYSGLIIFLVLSTYLAGRCGTVVERTQQRFERLIVPWIFWFVIYGTVNTLTGHTVIPLSEGVIAGILWGPSIHLWYMPFIFACLILLDVAKRHLSKIVICLSSAAITILILATTPCWRQGSIELGYPLAQYAHSSAGIFLGTFLLYFDTLPKKASWPLLIIMFFVTSQMIHYQGIGVPYMIAILVGSILASRISDRIPQIDFTFISQCSLGIYFVHILILKLVVKFLQIQGAILPVTTFLLSIFAVMYFRNAFPKLTKYWS